MIAFKSSTIKPIQRANVMLLNANINKIYNRFTI